MTSQLHQAETLQLHLSEPLPTTFTELKKVVLENDQSIKDRYKKAFKILLLLQYLDYDFSNSLPEGATNESVLSFLCNPQPTFSCSAELLNHALTTIEKYVSIDRTPDMDDVHFESMVLHKKNEYKDSITNLVAISQPFSDSFTTNAMMQPFNESIKTKPGEVTIEHLQLGQDNLVLSYPMQTDPELVKKTVLNIQKVWSIVRSPQDTPQTISVILTDKKSNLRSSAFMQENPAILLNVHNQQYLETVIHETTHAVFGAEAKGSPISRDFAEGCAMLFEIAFHPERKQQKMKDLLTIFYRQFQEPKTLGTQLKSGTQTLESIYGPGVELKNKRESSYLYGYCFIKALVTDQHYRDLMNIAKQENKSPYTVLVDMSKEIAHNSPEIHILAQDIQANGSVAYDWRNRKVLESLLVRFGFDPNAIFDQATHNFKQALAGVLV